MIQQQLEGNALVPSPKLSGLVAKLACTAALVAFGLIAAPAMAETWSDTDIGVRYGDKFAEPFGATDITKTILNLTHVGGYTYGQNFFNLDMLFSDGKDPGGRTGGGAQEAYLVYRNLIQYGLVTGSPVAYGPLKDMGLTLGFDANTKNDVGYASKKRMAVGGITFLFAVPGFFNVDVLAFRESNDPIGIPKRYYYKTHAALGAEWGIGIGDLPLSFEGFALYIASKGLNEFGGPTAPETNIDAQVMLDVGQVLGGPKKTFKVGLEYQYWKNKFGNPTTASGAGAGPGATAKTPMIRAEYHF